MSDKARNPDSDKLDRAAPMSGPLPFLGILVAVLVLVAVVAVIVVTRSAG